MICQSCGVDAPTQQVTFHHNIGLVVLRLQGSARGNFCRTCIYHHFWKSTAINLTLGWWGIISFFVTPFLTMMNIITLAGTRGLAPVPANATVPHLTFEDIQRLEPFAQEIIQRAYAGQTMDLIAPDIGYRAGVSPGQVQLYFANILVPRLQAGAVAPAQSTPAIPYQSFDL